MSDREHSFWAGVKVIVPMPGFEPDEWYIGSDGVLQAAPEQADRWRALFPDVEMRIAAKLPPGARAIVGSADEN